MGSFVISPKAFSYESSCLTGYWPPSQANLWLTLPHFGEDARPFRLVLMWLGLATNSLCSQGCLHFPSAWITGVYHHAKSCFLPLTESLLLPGRAKGEPALRLFVLQLPGCFTQPALMRNNHGKTIHTVPDIFIPACISQLYCSDQDQFKPEKFRTRNPNQPTPSCVHEWLWPRNREIPSQAACIWMTSQHGC